MSNKPQYFVCSKDNQWYVCVRMPDGKVQTVSGPFSHQTIAENEAFLKNSGYYKR